MNNTISDHFYTQVKHLSECTTIYELQAVCSRYLHSLGGQYYKYQWTPPAITTTHAPLTFFTCPDSWLQHYANQGYEKHDPKVRYCDTHQHPISWNSHLVEQTLTHHQTSQQDRAFWRDTLDMGMGYGATIPIRGMGGSKGMLCIAYEAAYVEHELAPLLLLEAWAMHLHTHIERLYTAQQLTSPLSQREQEILKWTVLGKTADDIAGILNLSKNTVLFHLNNLRRKLNVSNKHHLIAQAFALHLVSF